MPCPNASFVVNGRDGQPVPYGEVESGKWKAEGGSDK